MGKCVTKCWGRNHEGKIATQCKHSYSVAKKEKKIEGNEKRNYRLGKTANRFCTKVFVRKTIK